MGGQAGDWPRGYARGLRDDMSIVLHHQIEMMVRLPVFTPGFPQPFAQRAIPGQRRHGGEERRVFLQ